MPRYQPELWNDGDGVQFNNNCYDYCRNQQTGNFTQPGEQHGWNLRDDPYTCAQVTEAAVADGLTRSTAEADCGAGCWKVALVIDPDPEDSDFHWYRQDDGGMWSHKPGQTAVRNTDDHGEAIEDPQTAARGPYTQFCGWFCTCGRAAGTIGGMADAYATTPSAAPAAELLLWAGRPNPSIGLTPAELEEVRRRLVDLPSSERGREGGLGYSGGAVRFGGEPEPGKPDEVRAFDGTVTLSEGGRVSYFEDAHGLEAWLLRRFRESDAWDSALRRIAKTGDPGAAVRELLGEAGGAADA